MSPRADTAHWVLSTNPDDVRNLRAQLQAGERVFAWTVDRRSLRGDLLSVYGHGANRAFEFLGRVISRATQSKVDRDWWSYIELVRTDQPLDLAAAKGDPVLGSWPPFRMMSWTVRAMDEDRFARLIELMISRSQEGGEQWSKMLSGQGPRPRGSLHRASRGFSNTDGSGMIKELRLQESIEAAWVDAGSARLVEPSDNIDIPDSRHLGTAGYPDHVLVDLETQERRLLVIEVKRAARPGAATDGVTQLRKYLPEVARRAPGWEIKPVLVALNFAPAVLRQARAADIECWEFDVENHCFYDPSQSS